MSVILSLAKAFWMCSASSGRLTKLNAAANLPAAVTAQDKVFKAGAATSNITPPLGMEIVGNFAPRPIASHVHDELHVRCLVLDDGTTKLVFVVADTISLGRDVWDEAKKKIEEPVTSEGIRSGVNCTREKSIPVTCANERAIRVFASPG